MALGWSEQTQRVQQKKIRFTVDWYEKAYQPANHDHRCEMLSWLYFIISHSHVVIQIHVTDFVFPQVILLCFVAVTMADKDAKIVNYQYGIEEDGAYEAV